MQVLTSISSTETLSRSQQEALVQLLGDEDPAVFQRIHETILSQGPAALTWLERHRLSDDPRTRRRVRSLLDKLTADQADNDFLSFCLTHGSRLDIEEGLFLLSRTSFPQINVQGYRALLDGYAEETRNRVGKVQSPLRVLGTLNRLLFIQLGFRGDAADYYSPDNSYLNKVMDRRKGNPITLSVLYLSVCRRLGLPVAGVGLPGHFLCRYQDPSNEIYIDPFNRGKFLTRADCVQHLTRSNGGLDDEALGPLNPKRMLLRCIHNLYQIYEQRQDHHTALRLRGYLLAITKSFQNSQTRDESQ